MENSADLEICDMQFEEAMVALKEAHCEGTKRGEQLDTEVGQSFAECFLEFL